MDTGNAIESNDGAASEKSDRSHNIVTEQQYQEALIEVMTSITVNVADYQKLEIIMFLFKKCPINASHLGSTRSQNLFRLGGSSTTAEDIISNSAMSNSTASGTQPGMSDVEKRMQSYLLKCIENVALLYTTINYADTFKTDILNPLMQVSGAPPRLVS